MLGKNQSLKVVFVVVYFSGLSSSFDLCSGGKYYLAFSASIHPSDCERFQKCFYRALWERRLKISVICYLAVFIRTPGPCGTLTI